MRSNPSTRPFPTAEKAQPVSFAMVNDEFYKDSTLEPGMVRVRASNSGHLYLESSFTTNLAAPPVDCTVAPPSNPIILSGAKRAALSYISFYHGTPTINSSNNQILCYDVANNKVWTFNIAIGDWGTPQQLITQLQAAKTASGCTVQFQYTFRGATPPAYLTGQGPTNDKCVLLVTSTPVLFLPYSSGVLRGDSTFGFQSAPLSLPQWDGVNPVNATLQAAWTPYAFTEQMIGPMSCAYSRYLDIFSNTLARWSKRYSWSTSGNNPTLLFRMGLSVFDEYDTDPGVILVADDGRSQTPTPIIWEPTEFQFFEEPSIPSYFTVNPNESITSIDFRFLDEYSNLFVTMPQINSVNTGTTISSRVATDSKSIKGAQTDGGVWWEMGFYIEQ